MRRPTPDMALSRWKILVAVLVVSPVGWLMLNPPGRFGICTFALTTYGCIPRPASDIQVRSDGAIRSVAKPHDLKLTDVQWLLDPVPAVLIIGTGWDGLTKPEKAITEIAQCEVRVLKTGEAIRLYNMLKREGKKVAIHIHSTC